MESDKHEHAAHVEGDETDKQYDRNDLFCACWWGVVGVFWPGPPNYRLADFGSQMTPSEWIGLAALIFSILGAAGAAVWRMAVLNTSVKASNTLVKELTTELKEFRTFVQEEHRDIWAAMHRKEDK